MTVSKQSSLVSQQVPEFIRSEYPTFVAFLEAYYEYLDANTIQKNLLSAKDIDETLDLFIGNFKDDFAQNIPDMPNLSTKDFLRNAKAFYTARGTEASYKFLFRAMYGKEISVYYPETSILRASDGRWNQEVSCIVELVAGDPFVCVGQRVNINSPFTTTVKLAKRVKFLRDDFYEIFFDGNGYINAEARFTITCGNFVGSVGHTIDKVIVTKKGAGFKVGQIFSISDTQGTGAKIRVTRVDSNGGILFVKPVTFGAGYTGATYYGKLIAKLNIATPNQVGIQSDQTGGTSDSGVVFNYQYSQEYSSGYEGTIFASFFSDNSIPSGGTFNDADTANIEIRFGGLSRYPGYYSTSNGFLSSTMKLEDNFYYQIYSYVLKLDEQIDAYKTVVKSLLHPAGMKLFSEYEPTTYGDLSAGVELLDKILILNFLETIHPTDMISLGMIKGFVDTFAMSDAKYLSMIKALSDTVSPTDSGSLTTLEPGDYDNYPTESYYAPSEYYAVGISSITASW
jgi:hypothetical protein